MANTTQHMASQLEQIASQVNGAGNTLIVCPVTNAWYPALAQLKTVDSVLGSSQIYPTIGSAVAAAVSGRGDTIVVVPGTYTQTVELVFNKNNLTVVGAGAQPEAVKVVGPTSASTGDPALGASGALVSASNVTLKNIQFVGNNATGYGVRIVNNSTKLDNCRFGDNLAPTQAAGLAVTCDSADAPASGIHGTLVSNCRFQTCVLGINLRAAASPKLYSTTDIVGCLFQGNTTSDIQSDNTGATKSTFVNIRDNTFCPVITAAKSNCLLITSKPFSGTICGNKFAVPANTQVCLTGTGGGGALDTTQVFVGNYTVAGLSTTAPV